jgi:hypothetical protein
MVQGVLNTHTLVLSFGAFLHLNSTSSVERGYDLVIGDIMISSNGHWEDFDLNSI